MSRRRWLWVFAVFGLSLLSALPARWFSGLLPLPAQGVSGSLWHGQARQLGDVGPLSWQWQPWRLHAQANVGFQGQNWQLNLSGWPWNWQATLHPQPLRATFASGYRLSGDWQGQVELRGAGSTCTAAQGQLSVSQLTLTMPWSLALGESNLRVDCSNGLHLLAQLRLAGQHHAELDADLLARRAQLRGRVEAGAALQPVLLSVRWLAPDSVELVRTIKW